MNAAAFVMVLAVSGQIVLPPTVHDFMMSDDFVRVLHGPVGSGKSSGCVLELPRRACEQRPDGRGVRSTRFAVIRNTYRELEDTTRVTFDQWAGHTGRWRESDFAFEIERPHEDRKTTVKSEILFRALDRPQDVKKLLSLELTGAYINELREVPKLILDGVSMRVGRWPRKLDGGPSWYGVWADTNPWAESSEYAKLFKSPPRGFRLFRQPSGLSPDAENIENLPDGYYARMCAGKDDEWIDEYVRGVNPKADKGSIYGDLLAQLEARGNISDFEHPSDGVFATFDLGISDSTAVWFWRINNHRVADLVDWYEASGEALSHFFGVLDSKPYQLTKIWLPHDARARTLQTGVSTLDLFAKKYPGRVAVGPELSIEDGIGAGRWMLEQPTRIHARCADGLDRLRAYKYAWDEDKKVFSKKPLHDWTSHTADAFRYVACVVHAAERLTRKPAEPPTEVKPTLPTFEQALEEHIKRKRRGALL